MSFWSANTLRRRAPEVLKSAAKVENCAYALTLGDEGYVSGNKESTILTEPGSICMVPPGHIAVLITAETVTIPPDAIGLISLKSRQKIPGLINVSGFHVDPGFSGHLRFTVFNAGSKTFAFKRSDTMFLLWMAGLDQPTDQSDMYNGKSQGQGSIASSVISDVMTDPVSPPELARRIAKLESMFRAFVVVFAGPVAIGVVGLLATAIYQVFK